MKQFRSLFTLVVAVAIATSSVVVRAQGSHAVGLAIAASSIGAFTNSDRVVGRSNDVASEYTLDEKGNLFRFIKGTGRKCQVTNNVRSIKGSQHKDDKAVLYFTRVEDGTENLYVLHNAERNGDCPKTSRMKIVEDIKEFKTVSNPNTEIVNATLDKSGNFMAWDNDRAVFSLRGIKDFSMNANYGVRGAPFSSYVLFALTKDGFVIKVKGNDPENSKADTSQRYNRITHFKDDNNIR